VRIVQNVYGSLKIVQLAKKPQRVCDPCFRGLVKANTDVVPPAGGETAKQKQDKWLLSLQAAGKVSGILRKGMEAVGPKIKTFCTCEEVMEAQMQDYHFCLTCDPEKTKAICVKCSVVCHGAHKLHPITQHRSVVCSCDSKAKACEIKGGMEEKAYGDLRKTRLSERLEREQKERDEYIAKAKADSEAYVAKVRAEAERMQNEARERADKILADHNAMTQAVLANQQQIIANQQAAQGGQ